MATIRGHGSFVPFALPLKDDSHVDVLENLVGLRYNLHIITMYMKQEMYYENGDVSKQLQCTRTWVRMVPCKFWVPVHIGLHVFYNYICKLPMSFGWMSLAKPLFKFKVSPLSNWSHVMRVLSDFEVDVCVVVDLSNIFSFSFRSRDFTPSKLCMDILKYPYNPLYMKLAHHNSSLHRPPLHHFLSLCNPHLMWIYWMHSKLPSVIGGPNHILQTYTLIILS